MSFASLLEYNISTNLKYICDGVNHYLHSNYSARLESEKWFASLNLDGSCLLYVYGIGLGHSYQAMRSWLHEDSKRYLVYVEDNEQFLSKFYECDNAEEILKDPQVKIYFYSDILCEQLAYYFIDIPYGLMDMFLLRLNSAGDSLWCNVYEDVVSSFGYSVEEASDGGFILVGSSNNALSIVRVNDAGVEISIICKPDV